MTNEARDFFYFAAFLVPGAPPLDLSNVPADFPLLLRRNLDRIDTDTIRKGIGMKRRAALAVLNSALSKFYIDKNKGGRRYLQYPLSTDEANALKCAFGTLVSSPAFTDETLFRDFKFVLLKNNLINDNEKGKLEHLKAPLALYAIAAMHHVKLHLSDDESAELYASSGGKADTPVCVTAVGPVKHPASGGSVLVAAPMFTTSLNAGDWCEPELLQYPDGGLLWHGAIELSPQGKLKAL